MDYRSLALGSQSARKLKLTAARHEPPDIQAAWVSVVTKIACISLQLALTYHVFVSPMTHLLSLIGPHSLCLDCIVAQGLTDFLERRPNNTLAASPKNAKQANKR